MGNATDKCKSAIKGAFSPKGELSDFMRKKLLHEFHTFFANLLSVDNSGIIQRNRMARSLTQKKISHSLNKFDVAGLKRLNTDYNSTSPYVNKDGQLEWKDFEIAREKVCTMSGWKQDSLKFKHAQDIFREIWRELQDKADEDFDDKVSADEWLALMTRYYRQRQDIKNDDEKADKLPNWLEKYIEYKFNLFDRTADGHIDIEEFEYVLSDFGIPAAECRRAFLIFSENGERKIDMERFRELNKQFYTTEDEGALGNFITGKLEFN